MDNKKQFTTASDEDFIQDVKTTKDFDKKTKTERNNLINSHDKENNNNKKELQSNKIDLKNLKHSLQIRISELNEEKEKKEIKIFNEKEVNIEKIKIQKQGRREKRGTKGSV